MAIPFSNPQGAAQNQADLLSGLLGGKQGGQSTFGGMVMRYVEILRRGWWVLVFTAAIALGVAAWYIFQKAPDYQSTGKILISGKISLPGAQGVYSEQLGNYFGDQIELMQSEIVQDRTRDHVLAEHPEMKNAKVKLDVKQQPQASTLILNAVSSSSAYSQVYLDALMEEYQNTKKEMHLQTSQTTLTAITSELNTLEKTLQDDSTELLAFRKENNIGYLQEEGTSAGTYLAGLEKKLASLKTEYDLLSRLDIDQNVQRRQEAGPIDESLSLVQGDVTGQVGPLADYIKAKQQIALLQARIDDYSQNLKPKHPIIVGLTNQLTLQKRLIDAYRDQSKTELAAQQQSYRVQIDNTEAQIKEWQVKALDLSERMAKYDEIKGKYDRSKDLYDRLLTSLQSVDVNKNIDQDVVSILQKASTPKPIKLGMPAAFGGALLIGLLAGFGILILHDQIDDKLKSTRNFQEHFDEPIIGRVAFEPDPTKVLASEDPRHAFAESFSNLRSSLLYLPYKNGRPKTLLITSAQPNEGKSTVSSNLAISLAATGAKVLLVDADLRRGRVASMFDLSPGKSGLSGVLMGQIGIRDAVVHGIDANLDFVPRGKAISHPGRYLLSQTMDRFITELKALYDYVIFDSCPILAADDTTSLAPKLDATLFVVRIGQSSMHASRKSLELLYDRQVNVLGVILNVVPHTGEEYSYYNYAGYYHSKESEAV